MCHSFNTRYNTDMDTTLYVRIDKADKKRLEQHATRMMKSTGISPITISTVVRQFIKEGLKREATSGKGR